jgi:hypothetical protein
MTRIMSIVAAGMLAAAASAQSFHVTSHGEPKPLRLNPGRIALLHTAAARGPEAAPVLGLAAEDLEAHPIEGWSLARAAPIAPNPADAVVKAAADPAVDFASPVFIDDLGGVMFVTPTILLGFKPGVTDGQARDVIAASGAGNVLERDWANMPGAYRVKSGARSGIAVLDAANALAAHPAVAWAEPDMVFTGRGALTPNDPQYSQCWGLHNTGQFGGTVDQDMDAPEAWDITTGSASIRILIIDTGVDQAHPDINQIPGFDATGQAGGGGPVNNFDNHGTGVAGCCAAAINNNAGGVGIAPSCPAASARTFITQDATGAWTSLASWTVNSIAWGETVGARVTNNSNFYGFSSNAIEQKYATTRAAGYVHFASAGNDGLANFIVYPASLPDVMAVAALTPTGNRASFSNAGPDMFIAAPGVNVYSTDRTGGAGYGTGDYIFFGGTSAASPCAAGVAALVLSLNPTLSTLAVETTLRNTAVDRGPAGFDNEYGWGFVNALAALLAAPPIMPPGAFSLLAPESGAAQVARIPTFQWSPSANATAYTLTLDDSPDLSSPIFSGTIAGAGSYVWGGAPLSHSTAYHWRITASNLLGSTNSTPAIALFTTIDLPPQTFALESPADGATGVSATPTFTWQPAIGGETYSVQIDNDADFSSPITNSVTSLTTFTQPSPLAGFTTHYWRVSANNPLGSTPSTPASRSFTTQVLPPAAFQLVSPFDGQNIDITTPTFTWTASTNADCYTLLVDDSQNLLSPIIEEPGLVGTAFKVSPGVLTDDTRYYWRVTAMNTAGSLTASPMTATFAVFTPPCLGDANDDSLINFGDVTSILTHWQGAGPAGDANHDGIVNFIDVTTVLQAWGAPCR